MTPIALAMYTLHRTGGRDALVKNIEVGFRSPPFLEQAGDVAGYKEEDNKDDGKAIRKCSNGFELWVHGRHWG